MSDDTRIEQSNTCQSCHAGHLNLQHVTYFTWRSGELITVPDFPAWICDMCGLREYDQRALSWLNIILSPASGHKTKRFTQPIPPQESSTIQPDL